MERVTRTPAAASSERPAMYAAGPAILIMLALTGLAACATTGVYASARHELAIAAAANFVGYGTGDEADPQGVGDTYVSTPGIRLSYARRLLGLDSQGRAGRWPAAFLVEVPVLWVSDVHRPGASPATPFSALFITPGLSVRMPDGGLTQVTIGLGAGLIRYQSPKGAAPTETAVAYQASFGLRRQVHPSIGLRVEGGFYATNDPFWNDRGVRSWRYVSLGAFAAF
jgi:hypothetical protein